MKKLQIIGHLTKNAEIRPAGNKIAVNFTVAVNENYKKNGEKISTVMFVHCTQWKREEDSLKFVKFLSKGSKIFTEGRMNTEIYQSKDGESKVKVTVDVRDFEILVTTFKDEETSARQQITHAIQDVGDDLPF